MIVSHLKRFVLSAALVFFTAPLFYGQTLAPRAYVITPVDSTAFTVTSEFRRGGVLFDASSPLTDPSGTIWLATPTYYHSLNFFGRSCNITAGLPYVVSSFQALVVDQRLSTYRSGLGDGVVRFSVNLMGGPAMKLPEYMKWKQKRVLGVSLLAQVPIGQYDPRLLINIGTNRWALKPEVGYSERHGKWLADVYGGVWFFTKNADYLSGSRIVPGTQTKTQKSIEVVEAHLSYDFKPRLWVSLDGNFWYGGRSSIDGVENRATLQKNSRVGATAAIPVTGRQTLKFSYDRGAFIRFGGDFQSVQVAWQYSWTGGWLPKR
jgi:hypothetical protein